MLAAAAQSPTGMLQDMMNMTGIGTNTSPFMILATDKKAAPNMTPVNIPPSEKIMIFVMAPHPVKDQSEIFDIFDIVEIIKERIPLELEY